MRYETDRHDSQDPSGEDSFTISGTSERVTRSLETVASHGNSTDYDKFVNVRHDVDGSPRVEGVDVVVRDFTVNRTYYVVSPVTVQQSKSIAEKVGTVNNAEYFGFDKGDVLLTGARGRRYDEDFFEISYEFQIKLGETEFIGGDVAENITTEGWQYLWVETEPEEDEDTGGLGQLRPKPIAAYVEKFYEYSDFSTLLTS